jgi:acyl dehydratase
MSSSVSFHHGRALSLIVLSIVVALSGAGCDLAGESGNGITLSGRVVDAASNSPIVDAVVTFRLTRDGESEELTTVTDSIGRFSETLEVDGTVEVTITASKGGAQVQRIERVSPDVGDMNDLVFELNVAGGEESEPGRPTDILLQNQSTDVIRVQESGGTSTARITFQLVDSTGTAIGLDQAVDVSFRFGQQPGDAKLTPETVTTNGQGQATVNVSSGTTSGVVQIVAKVERPDGKTLQSKPVSLAIHGGLPNKCHFSLGPEQFNFPGLVEFGVTNPVRVFVGDKYGNPVVPGTSVYFSTNAGIVGGSAQTDAQGQGSVTLTSAHPLPSGGVGTVRAETVGTEDANTIVDPGNCPDPAETGNENTIFDTIPIVFSGRTEIIASPGSAQLGQTYSLTVQDIENGNPLSPGTTIRVEAEGTKVKATGNTEVTLDDTQVIDENENGFGPEDVVKGEGITDFTFRVVEDRQVDEEGSPKVETVTIRVTSPNGDLEVVLTPSSSSASGEKSLNAFANTKDATVRRASAGGIVVRAPRRR